MTCEEQAPGRRERTAAGAGSECLFWATAVLLLFLFLGTAPLSGGEDRWAEGAREMLLSGDWSFFQLNFEKIPDAPLLPCWVMAPFLRLFGNSELAVRFPGALAALAFLWGVRALGRHLFDPETARLGCWMALGSCVFLCRGRMAVPDMPAAITGVLSAVWFLESKKAWGFNRALLFFFLCTAGFLLNGPAVLLLPGAVALPLLSSGEYRRTLLSWRTAAALTLALAAAALLLCLPGVLKLFSARALPQELSLPFLKQLGYANVLRPLMRPPSEIQWQEWAMSLFRALMPWTPFLIAGWLALLRNLQKISPELKLTGIGMIVAVLIFGPFLFRRWHAVLPMTPLFLLFGAAGLNGYGAPGWEHKIRDVLFYTATGASSLFIGLLLAYPLWGKMGWSSPAPAPAFLPAAAGILAWCGLFLDHKEGSPWSRLLRLPHRLGAAVFAATLLSGAVFSGARPVLQAELRGERSFFLKVAAAAERDDLRPDQVLIYGGSLPEGYLFYNDLQQKLTRISSLSESPAARPGGVIVMFKNRKEVRNRFDRETKELGITLSDPLTVKKKHRLRREETKNEDYFAYPMELSKKNTLKGAVL